MYCTVTQLAAHYGWEQLASLVNHDQKTFQEQAITADDLRLVASGETTDLSPEELADVDAAVQYLAGRISEAGRFMDSYLGLRYPLPLTDDAITRLPVQACCEVLAFDLLSPHSSSGEKEVRTQADKWREWLKQQATSLPPDTGGQGSSGAVDGMGVFMPAIGSNWDWSGY